MILNAIPKHWFSEDFIVMDGARQVAEMDLTWWREQGLLRVQDVPYKVYRERLMSGAFILEAAGSVVARAEKLDVFLRRLLIEHKGRWFILRAKSAFGREFILYDGQDEIGSVAPDGIFSRRAEAHLPEELPLPVRAFILWLVIILWKRDSDSSPAAGGAGSI